MSQKPVLAYCYFHHSIKLHLPHIATAKPPETETVKVKSEGNTPSIWLQSQEGGEQMLSQHLHTDTAEPPRECSENEKFTSEKRTSLVNDFQARTPAEDSSDYSSSTV